LAGRIFWNSQFGTNFAGAAIGLGTISSASKHCTEIDLDFMIDQAGSWDGRGNSPAIDIAWTQASRINLIIANLYDDGTTRNQGYINRLADIGPGVDSSVLFTGTIQASTGPLFGQWSGSTVFPVGGTNYPNCGIQVWDNNARGMCGGNGVYSLFGAGPPSNTTTGVAKAAPGSTYTDIVTGTEYRNVSPNQVLGTYNRYLLNYGVVVGNVICNQNNGSMYTCTTAGTTGASGTGPSGTGIGITDGTSVWGYVGLGVQWAPKTQDTYAADASTGGTAALTVIASATVQRLTGTLTSNLIRTLSIVGAWSGAKFRVVNSSAMGSYTVTVGGKSLLASAWVEFMFDGTAWQEVGAGTLISRANLVLMLENDQPGLRA
jgi:hypothetical protein